MELQYFLMGPTAAVQYTIDHEKTAERSLKAYSWTKFNAKL